MKTIKVTLLALMLMMQVARAEQVGRGGAGVVCPKQGGGRTVEILDLHEGRLLGGTYFTDQQYAEKYNYTFPLSPETKSLIVKKELQELDYKYGYFRSMKSYTFTYSRLHSAIYRAERILEWISWVPSGQPVLPVEDWGQTRVRPGCKIVQIARYTFKGKIEADNLLYRELPIADRIAFALHESIYSILSESSPSRVNTFGYPNTNHVKFSFSNRNHQQHPFIISGLTINRSNVVSWLHGLETSFDATAEMGLNQSTSEESRRAVAWLMGDNPTIPPITRHTSMILVPHNGLINDPILYALEEWVFLNLVGVPSNAYGGFYQCSSEEKDLVLFAAYMKNNIPGKGGILFSLVKTPVGLSLFPMEARTGLTQIPLDGEIIFEPQTVKLDFSSRIKSTRAATLKFDPWKGLIIEIPSLNYREKITCVRR